jgi:SAM-dependent methyltransferase
VVSETYTYSANPAVEAAQMRRTAAEQADFFLPHLRPGMRLLDAGCGGGSITVGLAAAVAPGPLVGVDLEVHRLAGAWRLAAERGVANARFAAGDIYALPFPDGAFDAAFAHHVLQHLADPPRALRELRRVLRPGGVLGVRDPDEGATLIAPPTPGIERLLALTLRIREHHGGSPFYARQQRRLLLEAGFVDVVAGVKADGGGTPELTRLVAHGLIARLRGPAGADAIVRRGWATRAELDAMFAEVRAWGERPDAFYAGLYCSAIGQVPQ